MEIKFKPGSVVVLKSGSPAMTVKSTDEDGEARVDWFDFNGHRFDADTFNQEELELAPVAEDKSRFG